MAHARAGAHALDIPGPNEGAISQRVAVRKLALEHVADDLHIAVSVRAEALPRCHPILIDDPQGTEFDVRRIKVVGERKAVIRAQPAVIGKASILAAPELLHNDSCVRDGPSIRSIYPAKKRIISA